MKKKPITLDLTVHRYFAIHFNKKVWELLTKPSITIEEGDALIEYAYASNLHWRFAGSGINQQRGMYLLARVFLATGKPQLALTYAQKCFDLTNKNPEGIKDFDYAYAEEIMWKCELALNNLNKAKKHKKDCEKLVLLIKNEADKKVFMADFNTSYKNIVS